MPSILNESAWLEPATPEQAAEAVSMILMMTDQNQSDERVAMFNRMIAGRGYSRAELAWAAREMPFDEQVNDKIRYRQPITPADFEAVVKRIRKTRSKLKRPITQKQVDELCDEYPDALSPEHFGCCGYDDYNNPLYRYVVPDKRSSHRPPPRPVLDDKPRPKRKRDDSTGTMPLGEILTKAKEME